MENTEGARQKHNSVSTAKITSLPDCAYYIPNFISLREEELLLSKETNREDLQIQNAPVSQWTNLSNRRLQTYPSKLTPTNTLMASPLPLWLRHPVIPRIRELCDGEPSGPEKGFFEGSPHEEPNHVLVNEYKPGQGIMPHEDGSAYWPVVATVSLGASIVFDIYEKDENGQRHTDPRWRVLQEARSLLITTNEMYKGSLHGIADVVEDRDLGPHTIANWDLLGDKETFATGSSQRETRTSLTYRDVLKASNLGTKLGIFSKR